MDYSALAHILQGSEDDRRGADDESPLPEMPDRFIPPPEWDDREWEADTSSDCKLQFLHDAGVIPARTSRAATPRQDAATRHRLVTQVEGAIGLVVEAQEHAGRKAAAMIDAAVKFHATASTGRDHDTARQLILAQRNGLARVMKVQAGADIIREMTAPVWTGFAIVLSLSANAAALTGSRWGSTRTWLDRHHPLLAHRHAAELEEGFNTQLVRASTILSQRVKVRLSDYRTAPRPREIAERMHITADQLRVARANTIGLTSIDAETKRERDRRKAEEARRAKGVKSRSDCTKTAEVEALARLAGCNEKTIRRHRDKGTLDAFLRERGLDVQKPSRG